MEEKKDFWHLTLNSYLATFCASFSSKSKATNVFPKYILKEKAQDQSKKARKKLFCCVIRKHCWCNVLYKFFDQSGKQLESQNENQMPLLTLLYYGTVFCDGFGLVTKPMFHCLMCLKTQGLDCMAAGVLRIRVTGLVFCF